MDARLVMPAREVHAAASDDASATPGMFRAVVSTFDTLVDGWSGPRLLKPGCFARSLREHGLPSLIWSHEWGTPPIGLTDTARETEEGLEVEARLNLDHELGRLVHWAMTTPQGDGKPPIKEFSIGFDIRDAAWETRDGIDVLVVSDVDLWEYGPCLVGANVTRLIEAHAANGANLDDRYPRPNTGPARDTRTVRELLTAKPR